MKFSPKQEKEIFNELSLKERKDFVMYDFALYYFANTKKATAQEANKISANKGEQFWNNSIRELIDTFQEADKQSLKNNRTKIMPLSWYGSDSYKQAA